jgi:Lamin Tail Domain/Pyruvate phosphate dikinase, AMP/ATP-binding domain
LLDCEYEPMQRRSRRFANCLMLSLAQLGTWMWMGVGCQQPHISAPIGSLVINEVMSDNDSAWLDGAGEVEDFVELVNIGDRPLSLADYVLESEQGQRFELPAQTLLAAGRALIFADDDASQGPWHAAWKISAAGERLRLVERASGRTIDEVEVPALAQNESYARVPEGRGEFAHCRYATPSRSNGERCGPPPPTELPEDSVWAPYVWHADFARLPGPLVMTELALRPARFVEVLNVSASDVALSGFTLRIAPSAPGLAWPGPGEGVALALAAGVETLAPGARTLVEVTDAAVEAIASDPAFEGVVTLFAPDGSVVERVDFMHWPEGAALARSPETLRPLRFCKQLTEGEPNERCDPLLQREVGDRVRHLYTPGDFAALAEGDTNLGTQGVKFVIDQLAGDVVHLLSARAWALHYTFIRERIEREPVLDRCDAAQAQMFDQGWWEFSQREYFVSQGRRYLLGTLDRYAGSELKTVDYTVGDRIEAPQMRHGFFTVLSRLDAESPAAWSLRPNEPRQISVLRSIEGQVPVVSTNAPFRNVTYQPLTEGVAYGRLRFVAADELERAALGPDVIVVTDAVPNDIAFVAGLITEAFQTPLAHVNVLSQNRGTPNMALRDARKHVALAPLLDQLVRLQVGSGAFELRAATADEVAEHLAERAPVGAPVAPRRELGVRGVVDLAGRGLADLPSVGAKAAQLAELGRIVSTQPGCPGSLPLPTTPIAVPIVHYVEHFEQSGARELFERLRAQPEFRADPSRREAALAEVRARIQEAAVDPQLMAALEADIAQRFGGLRLRFRSSSNAEDLPGFNGAGLYLSLPAELGDPERPIDRALRAVWASLWNTRAYDEREHANIDQTEVAMGVLIHPAFESERANVIAITRSVLDPTRADDHYLNAQAGEASVANPAPGVTTEQLVHHWQMIPDRPEIVHQAKSSLTGGADVLTLPDVRAVSCRLRAIHDHFRAQLDPTQENRWFAMDVELKLVGPERRVVVKQARPYTFGRADVPSDCREF